MVPEEPAPAWSFTSYVAAASNKPWAAADNGARGNRIGKTLSAGLRSGLERLCVRPKTVGDLISNIAGSAPFCAYQTSPRPGDFAPQDAKALPA
jgi:hypothetical protein